MIIGKKNSTIKKEQVKESKLITTGVKSIKFWHEASEGETSIPFGALNMPADILANGLVNPTASELLGANLALFHSNIEVFSSLNQKLMEGLTYVVRNNQIKFVNNYTSTEGEIFEVNYKNDVITGTNVVDARPLTATGVLTAGDTDFNVGEAFKTNQYPLAQIGEVLVFVDGEIQYRNVGNATAAPAADGNYQEVHASGGFGTIIRFNDVFLADKNIVVISRNLIAERPDISMMQLIENLGGQLDAVISTVAALAGVPTTDFQTAANQIDLRAFGNQVIANRQDIATINSKQVTEITEEIVTYKGYLSKNGSSQVRLKTLVVDDTSILVNVDNTGDHTRYTFLDTCNFVAQIAGSVSGQNLPIQLHLYDSANNLILGSAGDVNLAGLASAALVSKASAGDYLVMVSNGITPNDSVETNFSVKATKVEKKTISNL